GNAHGNVAADPGQRARRPAHRDGAGAREARRTLRPTGALGNSFLGPTGRRPGLSSSGNATRAGEVACRLGRARAAGILVSASRPRALPLIAWRLPLIPGSESV